MNVRMPVAGNIEVVDESELRLAQEAVLRNEPLTGRDRELLDACVSFVIRSAVLREQRWQSNLA
jgi:hypothetical protein